MDAVRPRAKLTAGVIAQARAQCEYLIIGVHSDDYVSRTRGRPPIVPLLERLELINHLRDVDEVVVDDGERPAHSGADVIFGVSDVEDTVAPGGVMITPVRHSASSVLREALAPADRAGVA